MGITGISSTLPPDLSNPSGPQPSSTPLPSGNSFDSILKQGVQGLFSPSGDEEEENEDEA